MSPELGLSLTMLEIREIHHIIKRSSVTPSLAFQAAFATTSDDTILHLYTRKLGDPWLHGPQRLGSGETSDY